MPPSMPCLPLMVSQLYERPIESPCANAYAERWVRTVREECLDHLLILGERHLRRVLTEYIEYYNHRRAHRRRSPTDSGDSK